MNPYLACPSALPQFSCGPVFDGTYRVSLGGREGAEGQGDALDAPGTPPVKEGV